MKASERQTLFIYVLFSFIFSMSVSAQIIGVERGGKENNPNNLNDQDKYVSDNYIHQGHLEREKEEACSGDEKACKGFDVGNQNIKMVAKAFGMIVGMLPGGGEAGFQKEVKGSGSGDDAKKEDQEDYCRFIAVGTEMVAMFQQQATQSEMSSIPVKKETAQKESLYKAARSHEARAKNSEYQVIGWGATTVCYGYMATQFSMGWMAWTKLGLAGAMTIFYGTEVKKHGDAADKVRSIAKKLGGKGDCNPITDKNCYCAQPETMNDVKHCMPQIRKRMIAKNSVQVACMDKKLRADPQCNCIASDSCYDKEFVNNIQGLGFGDGFNQGVTGPLKKIARGELTGANSAGGSARQLALAKQTLRKFNAKAPAFTGNLNKGQKEEAMHLKSMGLPASLAANIASRNASAKDLAKAKSRFGSNTYASYRAGRKNTSGSNKVLSFHGGGGLQGAKRSGSNSNIDFKKFLKKGKKTPKGGNVLSFRDKASRSGSAQISKDTDRSVFEIVSRRYMISGWNRLEVE